MLLAHARATPCACFVLVIRSCRNTHDNHASYLVLLQGSRLEQVAGLLVDLKLLQLDCLEALAAQLGADGQPAGPADAQPPTKKSKADAAKVGSSSSNVPDEVSQLLGEAELLAAELYGQ
jgi:hypothetical protein